MLAKEACYLLQGDNGKLAKDAAGRCCRAGMGEARYQRGSNSPKSQWLKAVPHFRDVSITHRWGLCLIMLSPRRDLTAPSAAAPATVSGGGGRAASAPGIKCFGDKWHRPWELTSHWPN